MAELTPPLPSDPDSAGPYRLEGRIGVGGQGTVYLGRGADGRPVAIKLLHAHLITHKVARARFLDEVELAKRVAPFCTAQVLDSGMVSGQPYIVSEFVDGPSLQASVRDNGPRSGAALQRLALNTVTALAAIHRAEIVHRDFKPGNVLLTPDGPVVIDFGISRALDLTGSVSSQVVGTPGYMAPEHIDGAAPSPAADLFAWGATMVYAATGRRAFKGKTFSAVMHSVLTEEPDLEGLDGQLSSIVRACLDKDPAKRPTATEVGDRLRALPHPAWQTGGHRLPAAPSAMDDVEAAADPAPAVRERDKSGAPEEPRDAEKAAESEQAAREMVGEPPETNGQEPPGTAPGMASGKAPGTAPGTGERKAPGTGERKRKRRGIQVGAAALSLLTLISAIYALGPSTEVDNSPQASATQGRNPGTPSSPLPSTAAASATAKKPKPSSRASNSPPPAERSTRASGGSGSGAGTPAPTRPPATKKPSSSTPRTLGTISFSDWRRFCQSRGYSAYFVVNSTVECSGGSKPATTASASTVCRWKYPSQPNVRANGTTCVSYS